MTFLISSSFTDSLVRLTNDEQKAAKTTAFDLQANPTSPGLQFHRLDKARDRNFWSVRVNEDVRVIVHRTEASLLLCYVAHHDDAYRWAERRKLETHPTTGAAQIVEIRETVKEIVVPRFVEAPAALVPPKTLPRLFDTHADADLLGAGVPPEWLNDVRTATEDSLFEIADHLPAEAAEALLELATGGTPRRLEVPTETRDAFTHPDAARRFRVMENREELERALEFPWDRWTIFLHPAQRELVERNYNGPARVAGSAGTGKTIVALHRAVHVARSNPEARVLLTTFSAPLAHALEARLRRLIGHQPRLAERIEVRDLAGLAQRLYRLHFGRLVIASRDVLTSLLREEAAKRPEERSSVPFLRSEWEDVVEAWRIASWEEYRDARRLGRKTRLPESRRAALWEVFAAVRARLSAEGLSTSSDVYDRLHDHYAAGAALPFEFCVVDESQDLGAAQLRFLASLGGPDGSRLFFAGDLGQRIFQQAFSWLSLGLDVRGRSRVLKVNYRTSHQIRSQADRLLGPEIADVDGVTEDRRHTVSVFNGPNPDVRVIAAEAGEIDAVADWLTRCSRDGISAREIALFVRAEGQVDRALAAARKAGIPARIIDDEVRDAVDQVSVSTMPLAKGLEFRAVAVMACDDEVLPLQSRIESAADDSDLKEVYDTERHLLYVACTRARDRLLVTGAAPGSEFLADFSGRGGGHSES